MYYTSYFANLRKLNKDKFRFVSIAARKPDFCGNDVEDWSFLGPSLKLVKSLKKGEITKEQYTEIYLTNIINQWPRIKDFICLNENENIVLLCYEKSTDFCHRHLLRNFLNIKGIECKEIDENDF